MPTNAWEAVAIINCAIMKSYWLNVRVDSAIYYCFNVYGSTVKHFQEQITPYWCQCLVASGALNFIAA